MIADANDEKVKTAAKADETLTSIQKEMSDMAQNREVRNMLLQEKFDRMDWISYGNEKKEEGLEKGLEKGREEGREEGESRLAKLISRLISIGKTSDIAKVTENKAYREELYAKYGIA